MLARCDTAVLRGLEALPVTVEVDISPGLPGLQLVGLADTAVQEARERVRAALRHSGLKVPLTRVVVSLAPADLRKAGPAFDLPIALGLLLASGQLDTALLQGVWSAGELGLDGRLRPVRGMLSLAMTARQQGARALLVPEANACEAALVEGLTVWGAADLATALQRLQQGGPGCTAQPPRRTTPPQEDADLAAVRGQSHGRRALEIAAAGGHHLLLVGPPGSGKTLLARCLPGLLPPPSRAEALELTRLQSVAGLLQEGQALVQERPFRSPHHSCSAAALIGGGGQPLPGDLSLAHLGVLFLDEMAEFPRALLDQLRQPLEEGEVWISRARQRCRFPCRITLVGATNPCPCGWAGDPHHPCRCSDLQRQRYWGRLSGPLLDRLDLQVVMQRCSSRELAAGYAQTPYQDPASTAEESSRTVARRVRRARTSMQTRNPAGVANGGLRGTALATVLQLEPAGLALWERAMEQRQLSARSGERILRVARTIADLAGHRAVGAAAVAEAISYRSFDLSSPGT